MSGAPIGDAKQWGELLDAQAQSSSASAEKVAQARAALHWLGAEADAAITVDSPPGVTYTEANMHEARPVDALVSEWACCTRSGSDAGSPPTLIPYPSSRNLTLIPSLIPDPYP